MKRYLSIILVTAFTITLFSCKKDFLEVVDTTVLLQEGYVVDLTTTEHFLNGIYLQMGSIYADGAILIYPEVIGDNIKPYAKGIDNYNDMYGWSQSVSKKTSYNGYAHWYNEYRIIRSCNFTIEKSNEFKAENPAKADSIKGQALAIRAWMNFGLVNMFAQSYNYTSDGSHPGIPVIKTSDVEESVRRQTVAEVYDAMINDLHEALKLLPTTVSNKQVMNYYATKALLARIYLFKEDYQQAKNIATEVLDRYPIMLTNYPSKLYTTAETEALFYLPPGSSNNYNTYFEGYYTIYDVARPTDLNYIASADIAQLFNAYPTDKRNTWVKYDVSKGWLINKFPSGVTGSYSSAKGDYYQTFFRSSEMALTAAEAFVKLNNEDSARYFLNTIRSRAGIPILSSAIIGTSLMDSVRNERRKEMAFDGIRFYDLLRWKQAVARKDALNANSENLAYPSLKAVAPIPLDDVNIAGLPQNEGY
jgi:tetratricopeptide (TPR) repeat protein